MERDQDRVWKIMQDLAQGKSYGPKLIFDPETKTLKPLEPGKPPDSGLVIGPEDTKHWALSPGRDDPEMSPRR